MVSRLIAGARGAAIRAHERPVLVDLDETLYLRNSTEDFIDCAWPGPLALLLLWVLEVPPISHLIPLS
jgi:hypothetical protein